MGLARAELAEGAAAATLPQGGKAAEEHYSPEPEPAPGSLLFHPSTLKFCSPRLEGQYSEACLERLVASDRRHAQPHV